MKKKKLVALLLALCCTTTVGALTACGGNNNDDPNTNIEQTEFTISFDSKGGTSVADQGVFGNGKIIDPGAPTKYGYNFVGWYKNDACTEKWNFETDTVKGHMTLYALWEIKDATADTYFDFTALQDGTVAIAIKTGQNLPADVVLPSVHEEKAITAIANNAFEGQAAVKSVLVPDSVKIIGSRAFRNCTNLEQILGGENVEKIDGAAFGGTKYDSNLSGGAVYLGKTLYKYAGGMYTETELEVTAGTIGIAAGAFQDMEKLTAITLPAGLKNIGNYAFGGSTKGTGLTAIVIPDSVESIGDNAFRNAKSLATVTIGKGVKTIGASAFAGTAITNLTYNANATVHDNSFAEVAAASTLTFGNEVTAIPVNVTNKFTGLTAITLGTDITEIPDSAFDGLSGLATVTVNGTLTNIGAFAFRGTAITEFTVNKEITAIGGSAFANCASLATVKYNAVNATGAPSTALAFAGCSKLKTVTVGGEVTHIPAYLFKNCAALDTLTIGANVTNIGAEAFYGTAIAEVTIPAKVATIGANAFGNCSALATVTYNATNATYEGTTTMFASAATVTVGGGVTHIPAYFVKGNTALASITLPAGVNVGDYAFQNCTALATITGYDTVGTVGAQAFDGCKYYEDNLTDGLIVQGSTITGYRGEMPANYVLNAAAIPTGKTVTAIAAEAFKNKTNLTSVALPASVVSIGAGAFEGSGVTGSVDLSNVTEIGATAFKGLTGITAITVSESVSKVGESAFEGCSNAVMSLKAGSLTELGTRAFYGCAKLTSIEVNGVAEIPANTFTNAGLTSVKLGNAVERVGDSWASLTAVTEFTAPGLKHVGKYGLSNLKAAFDFSNLVTIGDDALVGVGGANTSLTFGENLESLGTRMLCSVDTKGNITGNTAVTSVTIDGTKLTAIAPYAFAGCTNLTSFSITHNNVTEIGAYAFHTCKLTSFDFSKVTTIGEYAFCDSGITSVNFGENLASIGQYAFNHCESLTGSLTVGQKLTAVPGNAFSYTGISTLTVKGNVKTVDGSFAYCKNLTEVIVEEGVQTITKGAFAQGYTLKNVVITLPSTLTEIGENVLNGFVRVNLSGFIDVNATKITATNGTIFVVDDAHLATYKASEKWSAYHDRIYGKNTVAANGAIVEEGELVAYASLEKSIEIPANVTSIKKGVLSAVTTVTVAEENTALKAVGNVVYSKDGTQLVYYPSALTAENYEIPADVTSIAAGAFYNSKLKTIALKSETPPTLGDNAFEGCAFTQINVPAGKDTDYKTASGWSDYNALILAEGGQVAEFQVVDGVLVKYNGTAENIVLPDTVTEIAGGAFTGHTEAKSITLGKNLAVLETRNSALSDDDKQCFALYGLDNVETIYINFTSPVKVKTSSTGNAAALTSSFGVPFPKNILPALKTVVYGEGVTSTYGYLLMNSSVTTVRLSSTIKTIAGNSFNGADQLSEIDWGTSQVTTFENDAFRANSNTAAFNIAEFTIPATLTSIGNSAFMNQANLTKVIWKGIPATLGTSLFNGCKKLSAIEFAEGMTTVPTLQQLKLDGIKTQITSVKLPTTLTSIPASAFDGCTNLEMEFVFPAKIETIGEKAFNGCTKLTGTITSFPASLTSIGTEAFKDCSFTGNWETIAPSKTLMENSGARPFYGSSNLVGGTITLPAGMTIFPGFFGGTTITGATMTGIEEIASGAFYGCTGITSIDLSKVKNIRSNAFYGCTGLSGTINLDSVEIIEASAFRNCSNVSSIIVGASCKEINGLYALYVNNANVEITFKGVTPPTLSRKGLGSASKVAKVYVPAESVDAYKAAENWSAYAAKIEAIPAETPAPDPAPANLEALPADNKNNG